MKLKPAIIDCLDVYRERITISCFVMINLLPGESAFAYYNRLNKSISKISHEITLELRNQMIREKLIRIIPTDIAAFTDLDHIGSQLLACKINQYQISQRKNQEMAVIKDLNVEKSVNELIKEVKSPNVSLNESKRSRKSEIGMRKCFRCGRIGHIARWCRQTPIRKEYTSATEDILELKVQIIRMQDPEHRKYL